MKKSGIILAVALLATAGTVCAVDYEVNDPGVTNHWNAAAWTTNGVPVTPTWTSNDKAFILGGGVSWTPTSHADSTTLNRLEVKASSGGTTLNISSYLRTWTGLIMNWNNTGTATINHSAGEYRLVGNDVYDSTIGYKGANNTAIYNLAGTGLLKTPGDLYIGRESTGILNINGGTLDAWGSGKRLYVGGATSGRGTVNLQDGTLKYSGQRVELGAASGAVGTINQTGGELWLANGADMYLGSASGGTASYTISGGSITNESGWFTVGHGGTFTVDGSGATEINLYDLNIENASTVAINLDGGGSTLVTASSASGVEFIDGTLRLNTIAGFNGAVGDTYDLFWAQAGLINTNNMTFSEISPSVEFDLAIVAKDGGDVLQVTVTALLTSTDYTLNAPGTTSDWTVAAWSPDPALNGGWDVMDKAFILGGGVNLTPGSNPGGDLTAIEVKASSGGTTLNISENIRTANQFVMSWNNTGTATVNHSAGEYRSNGPVWLGGFGSASANIYNLSGTAQLKTPNTVLVARGDNSSATLNIAGGTLDAWGSGGTHIGNGTGSSGTVNLSAGLFKQSGGAVYVGDSGSGTIEQTGGKLWLNANMVLANTNIASGTYIISGGEIDTRLGQWVLLKDDGALFVVDGSGATSIEMSRLDVADGGVVRINLDGGGSTLVKSSRTDAGQGLRLSGTLELDTITGFNGAIGDTYDLFWAQTGNMDTNNMTFSDISGIADFDLGIVAKDGGDVLQATVATLNYDYASWAAGWGVDIGSETDDYDSDGLSNLYEFGLAGDPTDEFDQGTSPTFEVVDVGGSNVFNYVHPQRPNLTYSLEFNTDLIAGSWVSGSYTVLGTNVTGGVLDFVTNAIDTVEEEKFIRLIIE